MRRLLFLMICLVIVFSTSIAEESQEILGNSLKMPEFDGCQLGLSMPYILLREEREMQMQPEIVLPLNAETIDEIDSGISQVEWHIGEKQAFGKNARVEYVFEDNIWTGAKATVEFSDRTSAEDYFTDVQNFCIVQYGTPTGDIANNEQLKRNYWVYMMPQPDGEYEKLQSGVTVILNDQEEGIYKVSIEIHCRYMVDQPYDGTTPVTKYQDARYYLRP